MKILIGFRGVAKSAASEEPVFTSLGPALNGQFSAGKKGSRTIV
jgi:hypothetical protein